MPDAIVIKGVTKSFGPGKIAVNNLDLTVPQGSLTGFIGPNGAGKTTTIRMIMSIIFPDSGSIAVLGKSSATESKDRIGYLPEERGIYRKMKVGAFLTYMARLKGIDAPDASKKTRQWLAKVGLGDVLRKKCEELSKGMQQKVQFISAVIHEPDLLILDEVFTGLDPVNRRLMRDLINEQHAQGRTIVFSTHSMHEAEQLCDRIFMIHEGKKTLDMPLQQIWDTYDPRAIILETMDEPDPTNSPRYLSIPGVRLSTPREDGFQLELDDNADPERVIQGIATLGGLRRIELKRPALEDIFIQIVSGGGADSAALRAKIEADKAAAQSTSAAAGRN